MHEITLTSENFNNEVLASSVPVLVDFWAPWCEPCKILNPIIENVANEASDVKIGKVNIDDYAELAQQYGVMSVPTLLFIKNGKVMEQMIGVQDKNTILQALNKLKA